MIFSLLGLPRKGKTALCTAIMRFISCFLPVNANYSISNCFRGFRKIEPVDLVTLWCCGLGLDEAYAWLESRGSGGSNLSKFESLLIFQSGKLGVLLCYTAQMDSSVDKRLRELADFRFGVDKDEIKRKFIYTPLDALGDFISERSFAVSFDDMKYLSFGSYDTYERVLPVGFRDLVCKVAKDSPERLMAILKRQVDLVYSKRMEFGLYGVRDCNKTNVEYALVNLRESSVYSGLVARGLALRLSV